jgi:hypothetical protein
LEQTEFKRKGKKRRPKAKKTREIQRMRQKRGGKRVE